MNSQLICIAFTGMLFPVLSVGRSTAPTKEQKLVLDFVVGTSPLIRPILNASDSILLIMGIEIKRLHSFEPNTGKLEITASIRLTWRDDLMRWNPKSYGGVRFISLPSTSVWTPDITVDNLINPWLQLTPDRLVVENDGQIKWVRKLRLRTMCEPEVVKEDTTPPIYTCRLRFRSWTYSLSQMNIIHNEPKRGPPSYVKNGQWRALAKMDRSDVQIEGFTYPEVVLSVELTRDGGSGSGASSLTKQSFVLVILRFLFVGIALATSRLIC